jgi:flagellar basal-body rod protein FlgC
MDFFTAMDILASGLTAERVRMDVTASNLANSQTTRTPEGGPYKRRDPVFSAVESTNKFSAEMNDALRGVEVSAVVADPTPPRQMYQPSHPDANAQGYVAMPNINTIEEMVNMITASRAYDAGITAMRSLIDMAERALTLGK